jgi:hypothetical protein
MKTGCVIPYASLLIEIVQLLNLPICCRIGEHNFLEELKIYYALARQAMDIGRAAVLTNDNAAKVAAATVAATVATAVTAAAALAIVEREELEADVRLTHLLQVDNDILALGENAAIVDNVETNGRNASDAAGEAAGETFAIGAQVTANHLLLWLLSRLPKCVLGWKRVMLIYTYLTRTSGDDRRWNCPIGTKLPMK